MMWLLRVLLLRFIGVESNKDGRQVNSSSVDTLGLQESANFNKLSLLSEKGVNYVRFHF